MSFNANSNIATILKQLSTIGVPLGIVNRLILQGYGSLIYDGQYFAQFKWTETNKPVFKFDSKSPVYEIVKDLKQPKFIVLMGLVGNTYVEAGVFEDVNSLYFKESVFKYSKTFLADFDGVPLREQILNPTCLEDKVARLKNKFSR